jgi:hypothetical protein
MSGLHELSFHKAPSHVACGLSDFKRIPTQRSRLFAIGAELEHLERDGERLNLVQYISDVLLGNTII